MTLTIELGIFNFILFTNPYFTLFNIILFGLIMKGCSYLFKYEINPLEILGFAFLTYLLTMLSNIIFVNFIPILKDILIFIISIYIFERILHKGIEKTAFIVLVCWIVVLIFNTLIYPWLFDFHIFKLYFDR